MVILATIIVAPHRARASVVSSESAISGAPYAHQRKGPPGARRLRLVRDPGSPLRCGPDDVRRGGRTPLLSVVFPSSGPCEGCRRSRGTPRPVKLGNRQGEGVESEDDQGG